ncbi:MAG: DinB family protein [Chloroflexota bacterium]
MIEDSDPVAEAEAYRQSLLAALGEDDPAVAQRETSGAIRTLVVEAGPLLRVRPEPGEWSVLECVGHIVDSELVAGARERWIVSEDEPAILGYDQALWVDRLGHNEDDPELLIATFEALRAANLDLWARIPVVERARIGRHSERGPESYEMTFRLAAGHDRVHLDQARRALASARARASV